MKLDGNVCASAGVSRLLNYFSGYRGVQILSDCSYLRSLSVDFCLDSVVLYIHTSFPLASGDLECQNVSVCVLRTLFLIFAQLVLHTPLELYLSAISLDILRFCRVTGPLSVKVCCCVIVFFVSVIGIVLPKYFVDRSVFVTISFSYIEV